MQDNASDAPLTQSECEQIGALFGMVGEKWTAHVMYVLKHGAMRYSQIQAGSHGISQRMLTLTLRNLERHGIVNRRAYDTSPPYVEYELTSIGRELDAVLTQLAGWALRNGDAIRATQVRFDERPARTARLPAQARKAASR